MSIRIKRHWVLAISCLIISGCTEKTIVREVPASSEPQAGVPDTVVPDSGNPLTLTTDGGTSMVTDETNTDTGQLQDALTDAASNMVPVEPDTETDTETDTDTDTDITTDSDTDSELLENPLPAGEPDENTEETQQLQDPDNQTIYGEPGVSVDCENTLPCRWISDDSQFSLTVTNADNSGSQDRLQLNYTLETVHDTQVSVTDGGQALNENDIEIKPVEQTLGSDVIGNAQDLLAGSTVDGVIVFDDATESTSLSEWSITILDGGIDRLPSFTNIPVGTITSAYADCQLVLPCVWMTPQGDVSITMTAAGGYTNNSRLSTTFVIQSATTINVVLDAGAFAIDSEGTEFTGRTYSLGTIVGGTKTTAEVVAGNDLTGVVEYYRTTTTPTVLDEVSLVLYQDSPVPHWDPKFVNVPAQ